MFALIALTSISLCHATKPSTATVSKGTEPMKMSSTGPQSTLPSFLFMAGGEEGGSLWGGFGFQGWV